MGSETTEMLVLVGRVLYGGTLIALGLNNYLKLGKKIELARVKKIPFPALSVIGATPIITLAGLSFMTGYFVEIGALFAWLFLVPASLTIHSFWTLEDPVAREIDMLHFCKNIALLGASLVFLGLP